MPTIIQFDKPKIERLHQQVHSQTAENLAYPGMVCSVSLNYVGKLDNWRKKWQV